jgi:hypothetical protein
LKTKTLIILCALLVASGYGIYILNGIIEPYRVQSASEKFIGVSQAVDSFKKKYKHLPGDMNGDGKIGMKDASEWLSSFTDPREDLETVTFWKDLKESGLYAPKKDSVYPDMPLIGTLLVASHSNGDNNAIKGNVLIWVDSSGVEYGHEDYPLTSAQAADIDRKIDDGEPATGFMRAYGKSCYFMINANPATEPPLYKYSTNNTTKSCGVMYKISD